LPLTGSPRFAQAFSATMKEPDFLADATKMGLEVSRS
jgi:hypothetical protein